MDLKLKYQIYPTFEIEEIINCSEDPIDYIIEKAKLIINDYDPEYYIEMIQEKFKTINELFGLFSNEKVVENVLRFYLKDLTTFDEYQEFHKTYSNEDWFEVEVNAEIDLNVFKLKYDKYSEIEIRE